MCPSRQKSPKPAPSADPPLRDTTSEQEELLSERNRARKRQKTATGTRGNIFTSPLGITGPVLTQSAEIQ